MSLTLVRPASQVGGNPDNSRPVTHLLLRMAPQQVQELSRTLLDRTIDELAIIARTYSGWAKHDTLSARLLDWSLEVLRFNEQDNALFVEGLQAKIQMLSNQILISSLNQAPLEVPRVVEGVVWEDAMWQDARVFFVGKKTHIHSFACELIRWMKAFPMTLQRQNPSLVTLEDIQQSSQEVKRPFYSTLHTQALARHELQILELEMQQDVVECRAIWDKACADIAQSTRSLEASLRRLALGQRQEVQAHRRVNRLLREENADLGRNISLLEGEVERVTQRVQETAARLAAAEQTNALQANDIQQLRTQYTAQAAQVEALAKKANKKSKGWF